MITHYPHDSLGSAHHGWLQARHHFSFGTYHNPDRHHFGALRVINDDRIAPHSGFGMHPHRDMEIITYVREGAISHEDSLGNQGKTAAGEVQVMSAGSGIVHAEYNREDTDTRLFQIWIVPNQKQVTPRWDMRHFPLHHAEGNLPVLVSGRPEHEGSGALFIHQDAAIFGGSLKAGQPITQPIRHQAYVLVDHGEVMVEGVALKSGDGAEITDVPTLTLNAVEDTRLLIIDVPT